jgi:LysM repeat protein
MIYWRGPRLLVLAAVLFLVLSDTGFAGDLVHQVAKGETVYSISRLYKISQEELMSYNNLADASKLQLGMKLAIPSKENNPPPSTAVPYTEYTVSKNDTLYSIARARGVTLQALRDINGFSKNYVLKAGEKIKIPGSAQPAVTVAKPTPVKPSPPKPAEKPAVKTTGKKADASLRWPVAAKEVQYMTSNTGVLVSGRESESIKSLTGGIVVHASPWRGYGNVAVVETEGGYRYLYGACETLSVRKGDSIEPGAELGKLGIYPASGKPELVFMVSQNGSPVDPAKAPRF